MVPVNLTTSSLRVLLILSLLLEVFTLNPVSSSKFVKLDLKATKVTEQQLLKILENSEENKGRGAKLSANILGDIEEAIAKLESSTASIQNPIESPYIDGCWKLLYTSSPGTNSPIQRTFTAFDGVSVYQVVNVLDSTKSFLPNNVPDVSNIVCFGDTSRLRVTALASTVNKPLITPRKGDGKIFGLNIFGISSDNQPRNPTERIDFAFQDARFEFKNNPIVIPYPVPFKLLGDEAKGWIDNTYLSENLRIARGNKGTTFVLKKADVTIDKIAAFAVDPLQTSSNTPESNKNSNISKVSMKIMSNDKSSAAMTSSTPLKASSSNSLFMDNLLSKLKPSE